LLTKLQSRDDANPRSKILASNQTITSYLGYRSLWFNYLKIAVRTDFNLVAISCLELNSSVAVSRLGQQRTKQGHPLITAT
nr:hypothetical protein [Nostoc sp. CHAB 5844]